MKITAYKIIKAKNAADLEWLIEDMLPEWQPLGGPYVAGPAAHMQAIVKYVASPSGEGA